MLNPSLNRRRPTARARIFTAVASLCVLLPLAGLRAPGQGLAGNFSGTIYDPGGAVVPNATITLTSLTSNPPTHDTTKANATGRFLFTNLPAGRYEMEVTMNGFATAVVKQVTLQAGQDSTANVNLALGRVAEAVTVSAPGVPRANLAEITGRIRVGGNVQPASLVSRVNPAYPSTSQAAGIEGTVELLAIVGKDGAVHSLQVQSSNADHDLVEAAKSAVSQWRYSPAKLNGEPVEVITQIDVQFTLHP